MSERTYKIVVGEGNGKWHWENAVDATPLFLDEAPGIEFFVHKVSDGSWRVSEYTTGRSGVSVYGTYKTPYEAISALKFNLGYKGLDVLKALIAKLEPKREEATEGAAI